MAFLKEDEMKLQEPEPLPGSELAAHLDISKKDRIRSVFEKYSSNLRAMAITAQKHCSI